jgi:recombination associated protein RdgC
MGWVSPIEQGDGPLVYGSKRYWIICLQFEEKLLPASVIRQAMEEKIAEIQEKESRVVRGKEKQSLKDEITQTLLPKAFTKKTRIYGYVDLEHQWLILNSNTPAKVERFIAFLKRAIPTADLKSPDIKKPTVIMTNWLKENAPADFGIGQSGVLQDPQQQRRVIRCQHQDLLANAIQSLLKDGCEIAQLGLMWKDQLQFTLTADFSLKSIQFQEAVIALSQSDYTETPQQRFDADFVIMTEVLTQMIDDLYALFSKANVMETITA